MAAIKQVELSLSEIPRLPSGQLKSGNGGNFKYRGTLFRPSSATYSPQNIDNETDIVFDGVTQNGSTTTQAPCLHENSSKSYYNKIPSPPSCRIQSAKGRLERNFKSNFQNSSLHSTSSAGTIVNDKSSPAIINLNAAVVVPDKDDELLTQYYNKLNNTNQFNHTMGSRPSSAKLSHESPVSRMETEVDNKNSAKVIRPAVYGLKFHRQVFGSEPEILQAWSNVQEYPFKLTNSESEISRAQSTADPSEGRLVPSSLKPLQQWLRHRTSQDVLGLDPKKCLIFFSCDYEAEGLPEVPMPQGAGEDLPYSCIVATPRQPTTRKYPHPFYEHMPPLTLECRHTNGFNPETHGDISFLLNAPQLPHYNPQQIRQEITELENLLLGIGTLDSKCSFVQFQAEINMAKARAKRLILRDRPEIEQVELVDTFGLLKFTKEHDEVMKLIRGTRERLVVELARLEEETKT